MSVNGRQIALAVIAAGAAVIAMRAAGGASSQKPSASSETSDESSSKTPGESTLTVSYPIGVMDTKDGRMSAGTVLKAVDQLAGIVSRRHCGRKTVTISVDRILFLAPAFAGDIIHLSASVNRTWTSSMEIGVRVMCENGRTGQLSFAAHAYLTFVAKREPTRSWLPWRSDSWSMPSLQPSTLLEQKRWLLAGRRRGRRMVKKAANDALLASFRSLVFTLKTPLAASASSPTVSRIAELEKDLVVDAWLAKDPEVSVEGDRVVWSGPDSGDTISIPLKGVEKAAAAKGSGGFRRLSLPRGTSSLDATTASAGYRHDEAPLSLEQTLVISAHIVLPQHANSQGKLFGGQTLAWIESNAGMSARAVMPANWALVALDSMSFREPVEIGETFTVRSVVLRTYDSSIEVYAVVTADSLKSPTPRFVAESICVFVHLDEHSSRPLKRHLRRIELPDGAASQLARDGDARRSGRLEDKRVLQAVYG